MILPSCLTVITARFFTLRSTATVTRCGSSLLALTRLAATCLTCGKCKAALFLRRKSAALHFPQVKQVAARRVKASKEDPHLVTVAVDLNVKNLAVITVRQDGRIIETVFVTDHGLDQARFRHLKRIAKKQWQSGKPVKGEHSNQQLWGHVRQMNEDAAHNVSRSIANVCARYPGCVLLF